MTYLERMQHEPQTRTFGREERRLMITLSAGRDVVHLRPDIWCGAVVRHGCVGMRRHVLRDT